MQFDKAGSRLASTDRRSRGEAGAIELLCRCNERLPQAVVEKYSVLLVPSCCTIFYGTSTLLLFPPDKISSWQEQTPNALEREEGTTRRGVPFQFGKCLQVPERNLEGRTNPRHCITQDWKELGSTLPRQHTPNRLQRCPTTSTAEPQSRRAASPVDGHEARWRAQTPRRMVYIEGCPFASSRYLQT